MEDRDTGGPVGGLLDPPDLSPGLQHSPAAAGRGDDELRPALPEEIIDHILDKKIDFLVMGTHGRKGIDKILFGSVAERMAKTSPVPILLINPYKLNS